MPSNISNVVGATTVGANYLKTAPSTQFGTRHLSVLNIAIDGVFVNYANADSLFSKSVRALQQTAEVFAVFTPVDAGTDSFNVIIASDTQWNGQVANSPTTDNSFDKLEASIAAGNGGVAATVTAVAGFVAASQYGA
jgi:hypothetical protein